MAPIPVICDNCGQTWIVNNLIGVGAGATAHVVMTNNAVSPCPHCGGVGHTIDGDYLLTSDVVQIFTRLPDPVKELVITEFQRAKEDDVGPDELGRRIDELAAQVQQQDHAADAGATAIGELTARLEEQQAEVVAGLHELAREVRKTRPAEWATYIGLVIAILTAGRSMAGGHPAPLTPPPAISTTTTAPSNLPVTTARVGRNESCPCGSGKKYKFCHGRRAEAPSR